MSRGIRRAAWFALSPIEPQDISDLRRQWGLFARILATSYARLGLLPDGFQSDGVGSVLTAARRGLWNKWWAGVEGDGVYEKIGGLVQTRDADAIRDIAAVGTGFAAWWAMWITGLYLLFKFSFPAAHADTGFSLVGSQDLAQQSLGTLWTFLGGAGSGLATGLGQLSSVLCLTAMGLGAVSIISSSVVLLVAYVDDDEGFKGKYSVPFFLGRIIIAAGLLAPLGGGYDGGQRIAGLIGLWGSNKASEAWSGMVGLLADPSTWVAQPALSDVDIQLAVSGTVAAEACAAGVNQDPAQSSSMQVAYDSASGRWDVYLYVATVEGGWVPVQRGGCGTVAFVTPSTQNVQGVSSGATTALLSAQQQAFETMRSSVSQTISTMASQHVVCRDTPNCAADPDPGIVAGWIQSYRQDLQSRLQQALTSSNSAAAGQLAQGAANGGWMAAGSWMFSLAQLQSSQDAVASALPRVAPPQELPSRSAQSFSAGVATWESNGLQASGVPLAKVQASVRSGSTGAVDDLFRAVAGGTVNMLPQLDSVNPLSGLAVLGKWVYSIGLGMKAGATVIDYARTAITVGEAATALETFGGSIAAGEVAKKGLKDLQDIVSALWFPIVLIGGALAYLVPMLPYIRYFFAILGWLLAFAEVIFLVPLALVLLISAEKGDFLGAAAKACLWNVVGVVVRPILTVIGFVLGLMLISLLVGLLNMTMKPAVSNIEQNNFIFFGFIAYMAIYAGMVYVVVNSATKAAESLPNAAYRWLGANAAGERDDAGHVGVAVSAALGKFGRGGGNSSGPNQNRGGSGGGVSGRS